MKQRTKNRDQEIKRERERERKAEEWGGRKVRENRGWKETESESE